MAWRIKNMDLTNSFNVEYLHPQLIFDWQGRSIPIEMPVIHKDYFVQERIGSALNENGQIQEVRYLLIV